MSTFKLKYLLCCIFAFLYKAFGKCQKPLYPVELFKHWCNVGKINIERGRMAILQR